MFEDLGKIGRYLGQAARLMVGVPDYQVYTEHMRVNHPDKHCMTYEEFFRAAAARQTRQTVLDDRG